MGLHEPEIDGVRYAVVEVNGVAGVKLDGQRVAVKADGGDGG
jgi:hypothetical protein